MRHVSQRTLRGAISPPRPAAWICATSRQAAGYARPGAGAEARLRDPAVPGSSSRRRSSVIPTAGAIIWHSNHRGRVDARPRPPGRTAKTPGSSVGELCTTSTRWSRASATVLPTRATQFAGRRHRGRPCWLRERRKSIDVPSGVPVQLWPRPAPRCGRSWRAWTSLSSTTCAPGWSFPA